MKRSPITEQESLEISRRYAAGESSKSICQAFHCLSASVLHHCRKNGVKSNPVGSSSRRYTLNEDYFSVIDTEEKAYFLGLLGSDGYVSDDSNEVELGLSGEEDRQLLQRFLSALGSNAPVRPHKLTYKNSQPAYRAGLSSLKIKNDLAKHGIVPRKSLIYQFDDKIESHLIRHYIRGYFDGDGSVSWKKDRNFLLSITSSPSFIQEVSKQINHYLSINPHIETYVRSNAASLKIGGNFVVFIFLDWIYRDATIFLPRKQRKYLQCKDLIVAKVSEPSNFYNLHTHPQIMANAKRCAELVGIKLDLSDYNGLSVTREQQDAIISLYKKGYGLKRIRKMTLFSLTVIANTLARNGIKMRPAFRKVSTPTV